MEDSKNEMRIQELEEINSKLLEALKCMIVATDFNTPLPKGHPGHDAFLNIVARPRAKQAITKAEEI